ncbi:helix-turn-helix domain-containing protein [Streptomyces yaizuensis]|uniref:XRE family transcriptional regulator n=1 Tax=Streptomyces yaizuensis TaxID=2989713 RepID=A0ABQ5P543_9ACTN|nr:DUF2690 domain-containing protein [Streptomyces sp. YSPA8]GLF97674.1 XRE family transcriptional regulator [Streptomyces sp. YSPA8]
MARWKALPEDLDPEVREFAERLRRLVDGSGLSVAAVSDRTGYSKTSWERYLNGRILAPKGAVVALAEVTGANPVHLTTLWELAERAWSRAEARHDRTMEQIRISQARAALEKLESARGTGAGAGGGRTGPTQGSGPAVHGDTAGSGQAGMGQAGTGQGRRRAAPARGGRSGPGGGRRGVMILAAAAGVVAVAVAAVLISGVGGGDDTTEPAGRAAAEPLGRSASSSASAPAAPSAVNDPNDPNTGTGTDVDDDTDGTDDDVDDTDLDADGDDDADDAAKCTGDSCTGGNPEAMGCGGDLASTVSSATVGTAKVEVRYSKACKAAWARITEGTAGDKLEISTDGKGLQNGVVDAQGNAYTAMTAVPEGSMATACTTVVATGAKSCTDKG